MIRTSEQASEVSVKLHDWKALLANPVWREVLAPRIQKAACEAEAGCTDRAKSPADRAEHIEAYHVLSELAAFPAAEVAKMLSELQQWARSDGSPTSMRVMDAMISRE